MDSPLQNLVATESTTIYNKNGEEEENIEQVYDIAYKTYKIRFYGLVVIALANIASSLNWYSVAPVPDLASTYFDNIGLSAINWFSNVFMLCYLIAGPISSWVFTHSSVKLGILIGVCLQVIGAWLRYFSTFIADSTGRFALAIIGQTVCAIGQPFLLNVCLPYVAVWFSADGRASASMVGGVANALGMAIASIIVPSIVNESSQIPLGFLVIACITTGIGIFAFFIPTKPKTPPSFMAALSKNKFGLSFRQSVLKLATNWNFLIVFLAFSIISGLASGLTSLIPQIVAPYGIDNTKAGFLGAAFIVAGLVGSIISGIILDIVGRAMWLVKIYVPIVGAAYLAFYFVVLTGQYGSIMAVCTLMGFFTFSLLPVALDLSVESSYPVSEAISSSLLWMGNQVLGLIILLVLNTLRNPDGTYTRGLIFAACTVCPLSILSTIYNSPNKRSEFEKRNKDILYNDE